MGNRLRVFRMVWLTCTFALAVTGGCASSEAGREDTETIDRIVKRLNDNGGQFSALLMGVIESAPFQKMRTQATMTVAN